ncbi:glycerol dehydrogenase [Salirhabdus euzebyi]|uniref:Glycerol dehydrogenase n=1 Tax=Salirhabdus euzebyi TaxID=394506 RepID=A0A841Q5V3_9BACI|nr:iron-containing alcohol dehydrogenase family protein [Salirhabdus euzebyi]MBB6453765.1 glycerol dehydrogenase [Salirhabdus euzebyi]
MYVVPGPAKYIREMNLLSQTGNYIKKYGNKALLIGGNTALSVSEEKITTSLIECGIDFKGLITYGGECSWEQINRLVDKVNDSEVNVLVAVGGGKAIDTVKAVAYATNLPLVAIPTIAATCAAATPISIIYDEDGTFIDISDQSKAPDLVLVDTSIIKNAPYRFLAAGIGDTLAKWFESKASIQNVQPTVLNKGAVKLAEEIFHFLLEKAPLAMEAVKKGEDDTSIDEIIDAVILLSGSVSGYGGDACRTAAAHAIYSGLTIFPEVHETYHGEIVAFGIIAQLVMEAKEEEEIISLIRFYHKVGLPFTLSQLGIKQLTEQQWQHLGDITVTIEDMENMPFEVTPDMVIHAIKKADHIGKGVNLI